MSAILPETPVQSAGSRTEKSPLRTSASVRRKISGSNPLPRLWAVGSSSGTSGGATDFSAGGATVLVAVLPLGRVLIFIRKLSGGGLGAVAHRPCLKGFIPEYAIRRMKRVPSGKPRNSGAAAGGNADSTLGER